MNDFKNKQRNIAKKFRKQLSPSERAKYDALINKRIIFLLSFVKFRYKKNLKQKNKINIGFYYPLFDEIKVNLIFPKIQQIGFDISLPFLKNNNDKIIFKLYSDEHRLEKGLFNVLQPKEDCKNIIPEIIFCPLLAFDTCGNRIGYGKAFYDKYCQDKKIILIGIAYDGQKILVKNQNTDIFFDKYDVKMNFLISEKRIRRF